MSQEASNKERKTAGLALTLFLWFMVLAIGPMVIVGLYEYQTGKDEIIKDRYEQLSSVNFQLTQRVNQYFDTVLTNLFIMAAPSEAFLSEMAPVFDDTEQTLGEFLNSQEYGVIHQRYATEYVDFLRFYDYSDIILGDAEGNILYTVNEYDDLGKNLFAGELADTHFSLRGPACRISNPNTLISALTLRWAVIRWCFSFCHWLTLIRRSLVLSLFSYTRKIFRPCLIVAAPVLSGCRRF